MQYIDKGINRKEGDEITKAYLRQIWIEDEHRYPVSYNDSFKKLPTKENSYYRQMTRVLLKNQKGYCCYCMRRLTGETDTTLEHIIPQTADEQDARDYQRKEFPMLKEHMALSRRFSHEANPNLSKLPHTVCYDNLVASCHGSFPAVKKGIEDVSDGHSCNHPRGVKRALPLYFLEDIGSIIRYGINGSIMAYQDSSWHDEADELIKSAQLSWETLTDIRALWYVLRNVAMVTIKKEGNEKASRLDLLRDNLFLTDYSDERIRRLIDKFSKDKYWECFLLYDWFHSYNWNAA